VITPGSATSLIQEIIAAAKSKVGGSYVWGGNGPTGYDCSGLMVYAFKVAGISLPRTSQAMRNVGSAVPSLSDAEPGDLITFTYPDEPGNPGPGNHVALYMGDGQVVEAANPSQGIITGPVDTAHVDRIRRIVGSVSSTDGGSADDADDTSGASGSSGFVTLQDAGYEQAIQLTPFGIPLNPFKLPGFILGKLGDLAGDAAGGLMNEAETSLLGSSLGPMLLATIGVLAGVGLVVGGLVSAVSNKGDDQGNGGGGGAPSALPISTPPASAAAPEAASALPDAAMAAVAL
jgi:hypothetical protein